MEKLNFANQTLSNKHWGRRLKHAGIACALGLNLPLVAPLASAQESLVQKEINRRLDNARKANELLHSGDVAYNSQDYKAAVADYSQAFTLLPGGAANYELRAAAAERYATAATERSRQLAKGGDYAAAKKLLDDVLKPGIAPAHIAAIKLRGQIDDPIRYNHALTPEHVTNVQKVGIGLREADGFYQLGQYDRALMVYQDVLRIDPFNKAARRGMEKIESAKSDYFRAAYDHTRAEMLSAVDKGWELAVPPPVDPLLLSRTTEELSFGPSLLEKLAGITIETIDLDSVSLEEAIDFVRVQSRLGDAPSSATGEKQGINIFLNLGSAEQASTKAINAARIDLKASNLPLSKILDYITDQSHTQWRSDGAAILVTPLGSSDEIILSRTFHVPPTFLSSASAKKSDDAENIFDSSSDNSEGLLTSKISITDFLKNNGVSFPDGTSASYSAASNTLIIRNTASNIDLVEQLITIISSQDPVQVIVRTTIMRVTEKRLKSLGFDWMITPAHLGGALFLGGGTIGNGTALADMPLNPFSGLGSPITSGNRSGTTGLHADSIDSFIKAGSLGFGSTEIRAPGILTLTGVYSGVQVQMMMRGMDQKTGADILQKPSTVARSGERAKIEVIQEFIYPTEYEPPELPNSVDTALGGSPVTPATPTAFETRNVGITLEVEPTVGPNKQFIELSIFPELTEFEGFVNYGTPILSNHTDILGRFSTTTLTDNAILMPVFKTTRLKNQTITIQDGATIVLGGLMSSRKTKIEDKIPIFGDIPYVGRLFRSESEQNHNEAVIITVQAELIDPAGVPWKGR